LLFSHNANEETHITTLQFYSSLATVIPHCQSILFFFKTFSKQTETNLLRLKGVNIANHTQINYSLTSFPAPGHMTGQISTKLCQRSKPEINHRSLTENSSSAFSFSESYAEISPSHTSQSHLTVSLGFLSVPVPSCLLFYVFPINSAKLENLQLVFSIFSD